MDDGTAKRVYCNWCGEQITEPCYYVIENNLCCCACADGMIDLCGEGGRQ